MSFKPIDINILLKRFIEGIKQGNNAYGLPVKNIFKGSDKFDISVNFHDKKASTPIGPAAGPHSQLAQNIVLSWLAGARIIELKTIQINDELDIPRPCIDLPNICFNVEFSQELTLEQSIREYVKAYMIIEIIKAENIIDFKPNSTDTIFEMSAGYDYEGITKNKIRNYINHLKDAFIHIEEIKKELSGDFEKYKDYEFDPHILNSITLSTFHGCPKDEIKDICEFLLNEIKINTTIKMNPTLLGKRKLKEILHKKLGYHNLHVTDNAYDMDIGFENAIDMVKSLKQTALDNGLSIGVKFTNTLEVINNRKVFKDDAMYASGEPLHVLAVALVDQFRSALNDPDVVISFSGGVSEYNFAETSSLGLVPITACTDLLRPKGYSRLNSYIESLYNKMGAYNVNTLKEYSKVCFNSNDDDMFETYKHNTKRYLSKIYDNLSFYMNSDSSNHKTKKKDEKLDLFNCTTCLRCISVCPNGANFIYPTEKKDIKYSDFVLTKPFKEFKLLETKRDVFSIKKPVQIAHYDDACNECGNCTTFCPEMGLPFKDKPVIKSTLKDFEDSKLNKVFYIDNDMDKPIIHAKIDGKLYNLCYDKKQNENIFTKFNRYKLVFDAETHKFKSSELLKENVGSQNIYMKIYYSLVTILNGILNKNELNNININI